MKNTPIYTLIFLFVCLGIVMGLRTYVRAPAQSVDVVIENTEDMSQDIAPVHTDSVLTDREISESNKNLVQAVKSGIIGEWKSSTDAKFSRRFTTEKVVDIYAGKVISDDTWDIFTKENLYNISFAVELNTPYLQIVTDSGSMYFKVNKVTPEELELIYMDKGNILKFTKVIPQ